MTADAQDIMTSPSRNTTHRRAPHRSDGPLRARAPRHRAPETRRRTRRSLALAFRALSYAVPSSPTSAWSFALSPATSPAWRCSVSSALALALTLAIVVTLAACRGAAPSTEVSAATPAESRAAAENPRVRLDPSQLKQVHIEELSTHAPADTIKATGTVEFNADRMARILPPVAGQVQGLTLNVGDPVRKNDVLFILSSREVAAAIADHLAAHKDLDFAEKTFAMTQDLYEHQAASRIALQQSESELAKAKAKVRQSEEVLQVLGLDAEAAEDVTRPQSRIPVRSPIAGTVTERNVTNGQFVGPENTPLITIADISGVWVEADVFERDLAHIAAGQRADVVTTAYPDDHFSAHVARVASVVDAQTRTAKVRFLVANPGERLKPGMFTTISLYLPDAPSAASLTVPAKAVFVENTRSFAYVQVSPQEFARQAIETVTSGADRLRVVRGLKPGDRVVSDGVLLLRQLETDSPAQ
jgi:cobalt-zinc-cadmium efflux system membrane fusion protein